MVSVAVMFMDALSSALQAFSPRRRPRKGGIFTVTSIERPQPALRFGIM